MNRNRIIAKTLLIVNVLAVCFVSLQTYTDQPTKRILSADTQSILKFKAVKALELHSQPELIDNGDFALDMILDPDFDPELFSERQSERPAPSKLVEDEQIILQEPEFVKETRNQSHVFEDRALAIHLLDLLDTPDRPKEMTEDDELTYITHYVKFHYGLIQDDEYCQKHRELFVNRPSTVFEDFNVYTDIYQYSILRTKIIPSLGNESMPHIGRHMDDDSKSQYLFDLNTNITIFYSDYLYWAREIGKHFSCLTQMSNHIPGHVLIYRKDMASNSIREYKKQYVNRPHCLRDNKFFPESWLLTEKDQCEEFFENFNAPEYLHLKAERGVVYIRKVAAGAHAATGVELVHDTEEEAIRTLYNNGALCGKVRKNYLIQKLIHNPLLLNGHKFDFRVFMLIASTNPVIAYFYRSAIVWASTEKFSKDPNEAGGFITNASFNQTVVETAKTNGTYNGMTFEELRNHATQTLEEVEARLLKDGQVTDPKWLDNYLRPELRRALGHIIRQGQRLFQVSSSLYEIMGVDFMLDDNLDLWFIEANIYPSFIEYTKKESQILTGMLTDQFEIVRGLVRSRAKRVLNYINFLTKEGKGWIDENGASFDDYELRHKEFKEISKNYFEPEYEPSATNGFQLVVNENLSGSARYAGLISEDCL